MSFFFQPPGESQRDTQQGKVQVICCMDLFLKRASANLSQSALALRTHSQSHQRGVLGGTFFTDCECRCDSLANFPGVLSEHSSRKLTFLRAFCDFLSTGTFTQREFTPSNSEYSRPRHMLRPEPGEESNRFLAPVVAVVASHESEVGCALSLRLGQF